MAPAWPPRRTTSPLWYASGTMNARTSKRDVLLITCLASSLTPFMGASVNVAPPAIGGQFQTSAVALGWVATAFLLAAAVGLVPIGRLADLRGRKKVFAAGLAVYSAGSLLCGLAPSLLALVLFRVVQGIGGAMVFGTSTAILTATVTPSERGMALGWNVASVYAGLALGPLLGGILTENLGWRNLFFASLPVTLLILVLATRRRREEPVEVEGERFDWVGASIYGMGLVALMTGFVSLPALCGLFLLLAGVVGLVVFALWQLRTTSPLVNLDLFLKSRALAFSNLAALINHSATAAVVFLLSFYLQYSRLLSPGNAGLVLVAQPVLQATLSPLAGRLSDHIQPRIVASIGMSMTVLGLALLAFLTPGTPLVLVVLDLA